MVDELNVLKELFLVVVIKYLIRNELSNLVSQKIPREPKLFIAIFLLPN